MHPLTTSSNPLVVASASMDRCEALRSPDYLNLALSLLILLGMLISYLPQHYRIISRRTSEGISPWFVLLGTTSATSGFANILTVPPSRQDMACCSLVETSECLAGLLGIAQLGVQCICVALILVLFLVFFRYDEASVPEDELAGTPPRWHTAVTVGLLCLFHGLIVIILTGVFAIALKNQLTDWANFLGVMAAALAAIQYVPQIWTTYHLKHVGSLSIPMMCIQTPGGFLFAANLFMRLGWEGWSTWGIFLLTATMQGFLLFISVYYKLRNRHGDKSSTPPAPHIVVNGGGGGGGGDGGGGGGGGDFGPVESCGSRRPNPFRTYSEGLQDGLPGPYTAHPERYADTEEELERLHEREERQVLREDRPLLRPGGIGTPRNYNTND